MPARGPRAKRARRRRAVRKCAARARV